MDNALRVLLVFGKLNFGGAETMAMNIFRNIDKNKIMFDIAVHTDEECDYEAEAIKLGAEIFRFPRYNGKNHIHYCKKWNDFFKSHPQYKIIYAHSTGSAAVYLSIAKKYGLITISHSHTTAPKNGLRQIAVNLYRYPLRFLSDYMFACSLESGEWMFGKKAVKKDNFRIVKNGINLEIFSYSDVKRSDIREELNISNTDLVVGIVARLDIAKNHLFLLEVFHELLKIKPDSVLLIVGEGNLKDKIEEKSTRLGINEKVKMVGARNDIDKVLSAIDVFVLPSLFEGLPLSVIEAQAVGVPVIVTDSISEEVVCTPNIELKSINDSPSDWALSIIKQKNNKLHTNTEKYIRSKGFDVKETSKWFEDFFINCLNEYEKI